jgi:outer membrane protein assembly factor BamE (lipoprotein component of BamABCDE complex)
MMIKKTTLAAALVLAALSLSACALFRQPPPPGAPLAEVTAALGQPDASYPEPDGGQLLEYRGQPMGQFQHMARIGPDGRLVSYEQVLTSENFAKVKVDHWTKDDVLHHFGRPAEVSRVGFHNYEVWSYRYKEAGVWNSLMHLHFDEQGVVRQMLNGPDPMFEDRDRRH